MNFGHYSHGISGKGIHCCTVASSSADAFALLVEELSQGKQQRELVDFLLHAVVSLWKLLACAASYLTVFAYVSCGQLQLRSGSLLRPPLIAKEDSAMFALHFQLTFTLVCSRYSGKTMTSFFFQMRHIVSKNVTFLTHLFSPLLLILSPNWPFLAQFCPKKWANLPIS